MIKQLIIIVAILTLSCSRKETKDNTSRNNTTELYDSIDTENEQKNIVVEQETVDLERDVILINTSCLSLTGKGSIGKERYDINPFTIDTLVDAREKFKLIFSKDFIDNNKIDLSFINDSIFNEYILSIQETETFNLKDSTAKREISLGFGDTIIQNVEFHYIALEFKNNDRKIISWPKREYISFKYMEYCKDIDYHKIRESGEAPGEEKDFYINDNNGYVINFRPHFSLNKTNYYAIDSYDGYGDCQILQMVIGNDVLAPIIGHAYLLSSYTGEYHSEFGFKEINWLSDNELIFNFYHLISRSSINSDTIYYDNIGVKINYVP